MRRFLLITIMCVFAFFGNLNAQETVMVGTKTSSNFNFPTCTWYKYSYSQQIYTAAEINHAPGIISEITLFTDNTQYSREVTIYMKNTTKESFSSKEDWADIDPYGADIVYDGFVTCDSEMKIALTNKFEYTGGNVLFCVQDRTGIDKSKTYFDVFDSGTSTTLYHNSDGSMITPENISTRDKNYFYLDGSKAVLQLTFEAAPEAVEGAPATPTGLTAEALNHSEVKIAWNPVQDAVSYNVYSEDTIVANVTETSFTVEGLLAETEYCYKVSALNDSLESSPTVNICVTTLREPAIVATPETLFLGEIVLGEFWEENNDRVLTVSIECIETEITNIISDNEFFVLPETIDYTTNPVTFEVTYNKEGLTEGEKNATLEVTCAHGLESLPISAVVYVPTTPDVFELAHEITFTGSSFSDSPEFENLHDNYNLPNEENAGNTPDAVYSFELDKTQSVTVDVNGTNGIYAIYKAEDFENNGPKADNNYAGEQTSLSTFFYDFSEENVIEDNFILKDNDGDGYNWFVSSSGINGKTLATESWKSGVGALSPDNYIITKEKYEIKSTSKLLFSYLTNDAAEKFGVEISTDGVNFTNIWAVQGKINPAQQAEIDLSEYEGQQLYIALRHYECTNGYFTYVDNFRLTNNEGDFTTFPAGKYFLVAAAESAFTVNVSVGANPEDLPAAPQNLRVDTVTESTVTLSWDAVEGAVSYSVYKDKELAKENITETTYTVDKLMSFTEYTFSVRSFDGEYTSFSSAEVKATTTDKPITAPANVAVSVVDPYTLQITWDAVQNATSYNVYQGEKLLKGELTETSFLVEALNPTSEYCFVVSAVRRDVEQKAEEVCATTSAIDFNADNLESKFMFDFNEQSLDGLRTIDADDDGYKWQITNSAIGVEETYAIQSYSYYSQALNPDNYVVTKVPYAIDETSVVTLNARSGQGFEVHVGEHFAVVVSENGTDWATVYEETIEHVDWTNTSVELKAYSGKNVLVGVRHYNSTDLYCLLVDNFALTSSKETPVEPEEAPAAPQNLTAEATSSSTIELTWDAVENATSYNVYRGLILLAEVTETSYVASNLSAETEYCFSVTAANAVGESEKSEQACATTLKGEGISENEATFNVYPNPVRDMLFIETEATVEEVSVYDVYGRLQVAETPSHQGEVAVDMTDLNSGIYFVKLRTENGEAVRRILKF